MSVDIDDTNIKKPNLDSDSSCTKTKEDQSKLHESKIKNVEQKKLENMTKNTSEISDDFANSKKKTCLKLTKTQTKEGIQFNKSAKLNKDCEAPELSSELYQNQNLNDESIEKECNNTENEAKDAMLIVENTVSAVSSRSTGIVEEVVSLNDDAQLIDEFSILEVENEALNSQNKKVIDDVCHKPESKIPFPKIEKLEKNDSDLSKVHDTNKINLKQYSLPLNKCIDKEQLIPKVPLIKLVKIDSRGCFDNGLNSQNEKSLIEKIRENTLSLLNYLPNAMDNAKHIAM